MEDELQNTLKQHYDSLPVEIQRAIIDANLPFKLQEIVKNNKLMIDQAGKLEIETYLVLFGIQQLDKYIDNIVKNVGLPKEKATVVAKSVDELVFKNIREYLKAINEVISQKDNSEETEKINPDDTKLNMWGIKRLNNLPEIAPTINFPSVLNSAQKPDDKLHKNIAPINNIIESKLNDMVTVKKEDITIEEKTKLPEKSNKSADPYKEPVI